MRKYIYPVYIILVSLEACVHALSVNDGDFVSLSATGYHWTSPRYVMLDRVTYV